MLSVTRNLFYAKDTFPSSTASKKSLPFDEVSQFESSLSVSENTGLESTRNTFPSKTAQNSSYNLAPYPNLTQIVQILE